MRIIAVYKYGTKWYVDLLRAHPDGTWRRAKRLYSKECWYMTPFEKRIEKLCSIYGVSAYRNVEIRDQISDLVAARLSNKLHHELL